MPFWKADRIRQAWTPVRSMLMPFPLCGFQRARGSGSVGLWESREETTCKTRAAACVEIKRGLALACLIQRLGVDPRALATMGSAPRMGALEEILCRTSP